jgi:oxygen-dependent protoporphyrinogen oxidase
MTDTIVVGAGIAGLVAARELVLLGHTVRVLEASDRAGGQIAAATVDGVRIDLGAEAFATRGGLVRDYLERLGLADRIESPLDAPAWLCTPENDLVPLPAVSLLGIPSAPLAADVVRVVGRRGAWRAQLDALLPGPIGSRMTTVGGVVRRRMGAAVLERLVAPVVEGIHSVHPDQLPLTSVPGLRHHLLRENSLARAVMRMRIDAPAGSLVARIDGGMTTLVDALLAELDRFGVAIDYGVRVIAAHPDHVVVAGDGGDEHVISGRVLVAAPGIVANEHGETGGTTQTHLVTLVLAADGPYRDALVTAPRGTGVLVARGSTVQARALTHATAKWPGLRERAAGREIVRLSYEQPVDVEQARRDASVLLGVSIPADSIEHVETVSWNRAQRITVDNELPLIGEQVAGTGLAVVIAHAVDTAHEFGAPTDNAPPSNEQKESAA